MVIIVTDSCASVPPAMVADLGIEVVPYYVHMVDRTLRDGVTISPDEFYALLTRTAAADWPSTANPAAGEYLESFRRAAQRSPHIVSINMTGSGSGGYQAASLAARLARTELPQVEIEVIDTQQVALAHGWAVIQAARAARQGHSLAEVASVARRAAQQGFVGFTNNTLEYLQKGGRISRVTGLVGELLSIQPIIGMRNGMPVPLGVARTRSGACRRIVTLATNHVPPGSTVRVALMHVAAAEQLGQFRPLLEQQYAIVEWITAQLSPALGVHSGPGTVGIAVIPDTLAP